MVDATHNQQALEIGRELFPEYSDDDVLDSLELMELLAALQRNGFTAPSPKAISEHTMSGVACIVGLVKG